MAPPPVMTYLLWAPLGPGRVEDFVSAYRSRDAGAEHELIVAACGESEDAPLAPLLDLFAGVAHSVERFEGPRIDLGTYRELIARRPEAPEFVFGNSYVRPLAPGWLRLMLDALRSPGVGLAGPGGSYESLVRELRWWLRPFYAGRYPGFPNAHIRTSCFGINRAGLAAVDWPDVVDKAAAYRLESGRASLTRQVERAGLRAVVVGRDGRAYERDDWRASGTFRSGGQSNLLIADLRSDDYEQASPEQRARLETSAWGSPAA